MILTFGPDGECPVFYTNDCSSSNDLGELRATILVKIRGHPIPQISLERSLSRPGWHWLECLDRRLAPKDNYARQGRI